MSNPDDDKRRDEVLKRMLQTPPKKQAELKKTLRESRELQKARKMAAPGKGYERQSD